MGRTATFLAASLLALVQAVSGFASLGARCTVGGVSCAERPCCRPETTASPTARLLPVKPCCRAATVAQPGRAPVTIRQERLALAVLVPPAINASPAFLAQRAAFTASDPASRTRRVPLFIQHRALLL